LIFEYRFQAGSLIEPASGDCVFWVVCRQTGNDPETGFEPISLQLNDHTDRGAGGRQYGSSEDIETLQGKSNA